MSRVLAFSDSPKALLAHAIGLSEASNPASIEQTHNFASSKATTFAAKKQGRQRVHNYHSDAMAFLTNKLSANE